MELKVKKLHKDAEYRRATEGSAGIDLKACEVLPQPFKGYTEVKTGLSFEIPVNHVGLLFPRSSISERANLRLLNSVGVIDSDYRGEVTMRFSYRGVADDQQYKKGEFVGQMVILPIPSLEIVETQDLSTTERNAGGYGSTGV